MFLGGSRSVLSDHLTELNDNHTVAYGRATWALLQSRAALFVAAWRLSDVAEMSMAYPGGQNRSTAWGAEVLGIFCEKIEVLPSPLARAKVNEMVSVDEELKAAKAAKAAIDALLITTRKSEVLATLSKAKRCAVLNLSSGGNLNEARANVGIALSGVMHSRPTQEKIDKTRAAINDWIRELAAG